MAEPGNTTFSSNSSFFVPLCPNQHFQKPIRDPTEGKKKLHSSKKEGMGLTKESSILVYLFIYLFIWLAVIPSRTCFVNYLIKAARAPRPARGRPHGSRAAPPGGRAAELPGRGREPARALDPGNSWNAPGAGFPFPHPPEGNSSQLSGLLDRKKNVFGSSCSAQVLVDGSSAKPGPLFIPVSCSWIQVMFSRLWWFPPGADDVNHFTMPTGTASENWSRGSPHPYTSAAQGLRPIYATKHLHLWPKPQQLCLF